MKPKAIPRIKQRGFWGGEAEGGVLRKGGGGAAGGPGRGSLGSLGGKWGEGGLPPGQGS